MNVYALKGKSVWELATGKTPEEASKTMGNYFEEEIDESELELVGAVEAQVSYYYGHIDMSTKSFIKPCQILFKDTFGYAYPYNALKGDVIDVLRT